VQRGGARAGEVVASSATCSAPTSRLYVCRYVTVRSRPLASATWRASAVSVVMNPSLSHVEKSSRVDAEESVAPPAVVAPSTYDLRVDWTCRLRKVGGGARRVSEGRRGRAGEARSSSGER
jgi:hypothetical protein